MLLLNQFGIVEAGKPKCPQNLLVLCKIETRKIYRLEIRKEESNSGKYICRR
jgi:hypothetical protein